MNNKQKGMTLVEIIVAIAILGIIAIAFLPAFTSGFRSIAGAGRKNEALYIAQREMENLIADDTLGSGTYIQNTGKMTITRIITGGTAADIGTPAGTPAIPGIAGRNLEVRVVYNSVNRSVVLKAFMPDN